MSFLLHFIRYTVFIVLYPTGESAESKSMNHFSMKLVKPLWSNTLLFYFLFFCKLMVKLLFGHYHAVWVMYKALSYIYKANLFGDIFPGFPFLYYNFLSVSHSSSSILQIKNPETWFEFFCLKVIFANSTLFLRNVSNLGFSWGTSTHHMNTRNLHFEFKSFLLEKNFLSSIFFFFFCRFSLDSETYTAQFIRQYL